MCSLLFARISTLICFQLILSEINIFITGYPFGLHAGLSEVQSLSGQKFA